MVTKQLDDVILKTAKDTKELCSHIKNSCLEIKNITYEMMTELRDLNAKQDHIITNLRDEYYRSEPVMFPDNKNDYERDYLKKS